MKTRKLLASIKPSTYPKKVTAADVDPRERYRQRRENARTKKAAAREKLITQIEHAGESDDPIEKLFELLVPSSGPSKYKGGELVRAIMRILYRDFNDGDVFYEGYGVETCADAVAFLCEQMPELEQRFESIAHRMLSDDAYTKAIKDIADDVVDYVISEPEIASDPNTEDYLKYDGKEFLEDREWIPEYEIDIDIPDNVYEHIELDDISERDLQWEIESWDMFYRLDNPRVNIESYYVNIEGLDRETYDELEEYGYKWLEEYGNSLDDEYGSPEDRGEEDEEEEE